MVIVLPLPADPRLDVEVRLPEDVDMKSTKIGLSVLPFLGETLGEAEGVADDRNTALDLSLSASKL